MKYLLTTVDGAEFETMGEYSTKPPLSAVGTSDIWWLCRRGGSDYEYYVAADKVVSLKPQKKAKYGMWDMVTNRRARVLLFTGDNDDGVAEYMPGYSVDRSGKRPTLRVNGLFYGHLTPGTTYIVDYEDGTVRLMHTVEYREKFQC